MRLQGLLARQAEEEKFTEPYADDKLQMGHNQGIYGRKAEAPEEVSVHVKKKRHCIESCSSPLHGWLKEINEPLGAFCLFSTYTILVELAVFPFPIIATKGQERKNGRPVERPVHTTTWEAQHDACLERVTSTPAVSWGPFVHFISCFFLSQREEKMSAPHSDELLVFKA